MLPTAQYAWPLLARRTGCEVMGQARENTRPSAPSRCAAGWSTMDRLKRQQANLRGVIIATRGNHGQSIALAASRTGIAATIVVPQGNSLE